MSKSSTYLWQKPKQGRIHYTDPEWFEKRIVGKDPLERFMKFLSQDLNLSMEYTNHSIRATVISTLDRDGFEARHIMKLSSHKKESTIKEYSVDCPKNKRKEMFSSLSNVLITTKRPKTCTVSKPQNDTSPATAPEKGPAPDIKDVIQNLPAFDIFPMDDFNTIDNTILAYLIYETDANNDNPKNNEIMTPVTPAKNPLQVIPQNINIPPIQNQQVQNTVNVKNQRIPILPQMYFPQLNITINYNFGNN